ncbi:MAG: hypothetical protein ABL965_03825 [Nitrospira sp.]
MPFYRLQKVRSLSFSLFQFGFRAGRKNTRLNRSHEVCDFLLNLLQTLSRLRLVRPPRPSVFSKQVRHFVLEHRKALLREEVLLDGFQQDRLHQLA